MTPEQERWIQAMESGLFASGTGGPLFDPHDNTWSPLGVACRVFIGKPRINALGVASWNNRSLMAPDTIIETLQLYNKVGGPRYSGDSILQMMVLGSSLDDIAAHLRRNPANYFRKWR